MWRLHITYGPYAIHYKRNPKRLPFGHLEQKNDKILQVLPITRVHNTTTFHENHLITLHNPAEGEKNKQTYGDNHSPAEVKNYDSFRRYQ